MRYRIIHTTKYAYTAAVPVCQNKVHLSPRATPRQTCNDFHLLVVPEPAEFDTQSDFFGNRVDYFSLHNAHRGLAITATSHVELTPPEYPEPADSPPWEAVRESMKSPVSEADFEACLFAFASDFIKPESEYAAYAQQSFTAGRPVVEAAKDLTHRIFSEFKYRPGATSVSTPVEVVMRQKSGVCQDFAHLEITCLRSLGLAARYVSGYLRTVPPPGKPRLVGADASHAWLSVYCGAAGWIDFDPTNDAIPTTDHITLAYGRDYGDVCPVQGVFVGGGEHALSVSVDVEPQEG